MKKETSIFIGLFALIILIAYILFPYGKNFTPVDSTSESENITNTESQTNSRVLRQPSRTGQIIGNITVKISRIDGGNLYYTQNNKEYVVKISEKTKIVKQTNINGTYKDVSSTLSDIKIGDFVELDSLTIAGNVALVRVLE